MDNIEQFPSMSRVYICPLFIIFRPYGYVCAPGLVMDEEFNTYIHEIWVLHSISHLKVGFSLKMGRGNEMWEGRL